MPLAPASLPRFVPLSSAPGYVEASVRLYLSAFPLPERRTESEWRAMLLGGGPFRADAIVHGGKFAGFISHWLLDGFRYVEHFAVLPRMRGSGVGGWAIDRMKDGGLPVVLEVEPPATEMARRRIGFYERHGLRLSARDYRQPPYRAGEEWLPLRLMSTHPDFLAHRFGHVRDAIHRRVYGVEAGTGKVTTEAAALP